MEIKNKNMKNKNMKTNKTKAKKITKTKFSLKNSSAKSFSVKNLSVKSSSEKNSKSSKNVLVLMSGSIACYKACYLISKLVQAGYQVQVVASIAAQKFIGNATIEGITGKPILSDLFQSNQIMDHIHLIRQADLVIAIPATANFINKIAGGIGDDLASTLFLAHDFTKPFLIAPAMNTKMYMHPVTQVSIKKLKDFGIQILETASGVLACGEVGWGKLLDPELIFQEIEKNLMGINNGNKNSNLISLNTKLKKSKTNSDSMFKSGLKKILVTAGGTQESIDAVRVITNLSTGKTGIKIADLFFQMGFEVTLLKAKKSNCEQLNSEIRTVDFETYQDLSISLKNELEKNNYDFVIHTAAVSDYSIATIDDHPIGGNNNLYAKKKISSNKAEIIVKLKRNPKLIDKIKKWSRNKKIKLIGFKMTVTDSISEQKIAVEKLFKHSKADLVIQNDISEINSTKHLFHIYSAGVNTSVCLNSVDGTNNLSEEIWKWMGL